MLNFTEDFWKDEIRDGFRVSEAMKRAWATQMTVMDRVLEIAQKHSIRVFMDYGSLLGTIRHGGYIPWDDDLDMCVLRSDYMKLIMILKDELPEYCRVYSFYTYRDYDSPKAFITNRQRIDVGEDPAEAEITRLYHGCPFMTGIDLYPLDFVPDDKEKWFTIKNLYSAVYDLAFQFEAYRARGELEGYLTEIEDILGRKVKRDEHLRESIWKLADSVAMMTTRKEARSVVWYPDAVATKTDIRRRASWYKDVVYKPFECMQAPVPIGYDDVLKVRFGENYMTPRQESGAHEYPFFAEQERKILAFKMKSKLQEIY